MIPTLLSVGKVYIITLMNSQNLTFPVAAEPSPDLLLEELGGTESTFSLQEEEEKRSHTRPKSSTEGRALELLGSGVQTDAVASALGVNPSRISQLLSNTEFAEKVAALRYQNLQKHNERDNKYDRVEDALIVKLEKSLPFMYKPPEILRAIQVINGAKRRGQNAPTQSSTHQNIVNLVLPVQVIKQFSTNVNNQVTKVGSEDGVQELITMPSGDLKKQLDAIQAKRIPAPVPTQETIIEATEVKESEHSECSDSEEQEE
jgi:hypothetical protein